jgi:hypothetical protein
MRSSCMKVVLTSVVLLTAACDSAKDQWVSVPMTSCPGKDWDELKKSPEMQKFYGAATCGASGKSYTAEWRCGKGVAEVKCQ